MSEVDPHISASYRAVSGDEPPPHLDAAVLAAAKRAVGAGPQSTWAPGSARRWYVPVSLAAVVVLSVVVTLQVERERPDLAMPDLKTEVRTEAVPVEPKQKEQLPQPAPAAPARLEPKAEKDQAPAPAAAAPQPERQRAPSAREDVARQGTAGPAEAKKLAEAPAGGESANARGAFAPDPAPAAAPAPPAPKPAAELAQADQRRNEVARIEAREEPRDKLRAADASAGAATGRSAAPAAPAASAAPQASQPPLAALAKRDLAPDAWLERIAELRRLGRDAEADEQLAEFRRRHPDYVISPAMQERIAPRK